MNLEEAKKLLDSWMKFSEDVQPHCPVGEEWLRILRARTAELIKQIN